MLRVTELTRGDLISSRDFFFLKSNPNRKLKIQLKTNTENNTLLYISTCFR